MTTLITLARSVFRFRRRAVVPTPRAWEQLGRVQTQAQAYHALSDDQLRRRTEDVRRAIAQAPQPPPDEILVPAAALVTTAARRALAIDYHEVQILAGLNLARGGILEMQTGEGKTLVVAFPAFLQAARGRGLHVMTVNSYLAERDCQQMTPLFRRLGLSVGWLAPQASRDDKRRAYACDITYGAGYEFGFDYLRDQLALASLPGATLGQGIRRRLGADAFPVAATVQRGQAAAVVDEADSVMIDEAMTPLLLAGGPPTPAGDATALELARAAAAQLTPDQDFVLDRADRSVTLTPHGRCRIQGPAPAAAAGGLRRPWPQYVEQALHAHWLLHRDVDYVVEDDRIVLVDTQTGRVHRERSWRDGLHQALQAKERVTLTAELRPQARIGRQQYFRRYAWLCGMSGTVAGSEAEFRRVYGLPTALVPPWKPCRRQLRPTRFFGRAAAKGAAVVAEIERVHATGQPLLVGTWSIADSEWLAQQCAERGIPGQLLNGKQDAQEAAIVAQAGLVGAVTIATHLAGRGTDIRLGPGAAERGGLHVLATERHESGRVDRQLLGRAARQGDPGSYQAFVSADDALLVRYGPDLSKRMQRLAGPDGEIAADLSAAVDAVQRRAERALEEQRRQTLAAGQWWEDTLARLVGQP